jgi:hypothetical protein
MGGSRAEVLLLLLTGIVLLLMVAIIGLFLRMNQLQREVLAALEPLRPAQPVSPPVPKPLPLPSLTSPAGPSRWRRWRAGGCCWPSPLPGARPAGRCTPTCEPSPKRIRMWRW